MSYLNDKTNLQTLLSRSGGEVIGAAQRTIAYSAVADGGTGLINITAAAHGLKKNQTFYIAAGTYAGIHKVMKVISVNVIQADGTFSITAAGNINLTASLYGHGFIVNNATGLVFAELEFENKDIDPVTWKSKVYKDSEIVPVPLKKIRITGGDITVVRKSPPAILTYTNR